jgi:hypothetical protein
MSKSMWFAILALALILAISIFTPAKSYYLVNENPDKVNLSLSQIGPFATLESCNKAGQLLTEEFARAEHDTSAVDVRGFMLCVPSR